MTSWVLLTVTAFVYCGTKAEGSHKFGGCDVYSVEEYRNLRDVADCRSCVSVFGEYYCKEWNCPDTPCANPVFEENQCCPYCPDTCSYRGKIFDVDDSNVFRCNDGQNMCMCVNSGKIEQVTNNHDPIEFNRALNQCFWKRTELH